MPQGLYIDLNDGRPPMEITSGVRCPSYCMTTEQSISSSSVAVSNYINGSQLLFIPHQTVQSYYVGVSLIPTVDMLSGVSFSGGTMTHTTWNAGGRDIRMIWPGSVWQILPASSGSIGLYIQDSTDFLSITDATMSGQCVYAAEITVNGSWNTPTVAGFGREKYSVFARWNAAGVVVDFDGSKIMAFVERDGEDVPASVSMTVAIFASGVAPTPGDGLTIINSKGACTFSTVRRPFIYHGALYTPSFTNTDIGNRMVLLGRYGYSSKTAFGWCWLKFAGLVMQGNNVRLGGGQVQNYWTDQYPVTGQRATAISVPCVDNIY